MDQDADLGGAAAAGEAGRDDLIDVVDLDPVTLDQDINADAVVLALADPDITITFHAEDSGWDDDY